MKQYLIIILLLISSLPAWAQQRREMSKEDREKIQTARIAFITNRLQLTSDVAKNFWPIFNEFETDKQELSKKYNQQKRNLVAPEDFRNMSDDNASKMLDMYFDQKEAELKLEREYMKKFQEVLTRRQVWSIIRFEGDFRREFMNKLRKRRKEDKPINKGNTKEGN